MTTDTLHNGPPGLLHHVPMKTAEMARAGRILAGWSQAKLAEKAGLSVPTIQRMENPQYGPLRSSGANLEKLRLAYCVRIEPVER